METIVITGSTRGIGLGLADAFLARGCRVVVNGRSSTSVEKALAELSHTYDAARSHGQAGDVSNLADMERLWQTAVDRFGRVDIWINNAGVGHPMQPVWELPPEKVKQVVDIDLLGVLSGTRVATARFNQRELFD